MLKVMFTLLVLASAGLAQSSSDGSFSVHHSKHANFSLSPAQMREAESLYHSACAVVQREFHTGNGKLHPHFTVVIGKDSNEVQHVVVNGNKANPGAEIWLKKWNPIMFTQGVVVLALDETLTTDMVTQLSDRAVHYSNATVEVSGLK